MGKNRNRLVYLLEMYELLLGSPQTFNSIRTEIGIGYNSLNRLLDKLIEKELVYTKIRDNLVYYYPTPTLFDLFTYSFYDGLQEVRDL